MVLDDEGTRVSGERSTTSGTPAPPGEKPAGRTRAIRRAPLIRTAFRGLVESDAGTLRNEVPASLSPRPPGRLG